MTGSPYQIGDRVEVFRGRRSVGVQGEVFWAEYTVRQYGDDESSIWEGWRLGIKDDLGEKHWVNAHDVRPCKAPEPHAWQKGDRVRWTHQGREGTGVVFWFGKSKYGPGMRVGLKDDASGESVWADATEVHPSTVDGLQLLRDKLYEPPSADLWSELVSLFDGWSPDDPSVTLAVDYAEAHMEDWPDALRTLPRAWRVQLLKGKPVPGLRLVRHAIFDPRDAVLRDEGAQCIASSGLRHATLLDLRGHTITDEGLCLLVESGVLACVRHLELERNWFSGAGVVALAASPHASMLEYLGLAHTYVGQPAAEALAASTCLPALRVLELKGWLGGPAAAQAILLSRTLHRDVRRSVGEQLTVPELKKVAGKVGVEISSRSKKSDLLDAIVRAVEPDPAA